MPQGEYLQYGGQAILEGVMMRSPRYFAVACRAPDGSIVLQTEAIEKTWIGRQKWLKLPFLRGSLALLDAMALGIRAMRFASKVQLDPDLQKADAVAEEPKPPKTKAAQVGDALVSLVLACVFGVLPFSGLGSSPGRPARWAFDNFGGKLLVVIAVLLLINGMAQLYRILRPVRAGVAPGAVASSRIQEGAIGLTMMFSLCFGLFLFNYVPNLVAEYSQRAIGAHSSTQINLVSEIVKVAIFLGYIGLIGQFKDVREVFKYHGAEHKAINTLEAEQELEIETCLAQTRLHPRCGTSFAIIVLILGLFVFTFVPRYPVTGHQGAPLTDVTVRFLLGRSP